MKHLLKPYKSLIKTIQTLSKPWGVDSYSPPGPTSIRFSPPQDPRSGPQGTVEITGRTRAGAAVGMGSGCGCPSPGRLRKTATN